MEAFTANETHAHNWVWAALFVLLGLLTIANYFYGHRAHPYLLLQGCGLLLYVPHAFIRPGRSSLPALGRLGNLQLHRLVSGVAVFGLVMFAAGIVLQWV